MRDLGKPILDAGYGIRDHHNCFVGEAFPRGAEALAEAASLDYRGRMPLPQENQFQRNLAAPI
jgi:hypothetical protein